MNCPRRDLYVQVLNKQDLYNFDLQVVGRAQSLVRSFRAESWTGCLIRNPASVFLEAELVAMTSTDVIFDIEHSQDCLVQGKCSLFARWATAPR
ncbi:catalase [Pseudomonas sp. ANT_H12B]|nr:catalase [Pseudomonas sp. ANT_H12B]